LRRVFGLDVLHCPGCGGRRRIVAAITQGPVMRAILESLGLPAEPPVAATARGPPELPGFRRRASAFRDSPLDP
jgi:hypothetical protein